MDVKDLIRIKRVERGWTMKDLADRIGVSEGTISRWESGEISNMRRKAILALNNTLGIPIEDLVGTAKRNAIMHNPQDNDGPIEVDMSASVEDNNLGLRVRFKILERYVHLKAFAEIIGMPYSTLQSVLNNMQGATLHNLQKIAKGLNVTIDDLINGSGSRQSVNTARSPVLARALNELSDNDLEKIEEITNLYLKQKERDTK